jgi:hypothetical protein
MRVKSVGRLDKWFELLEKSASVVLNVLRAARAASLVLADRTLKGVCP